jgi:hypothetical protein
MKHALNESVQVLPWKEATRLASTERQRCLPIKYAPNKTAWNCKEARKRSKSARAGDASAVRHLCAPKISTEEQELDLWVIHFSQHEMGMLSDLHDRS